MSSAGHAVLQGVLQAWPSGSEAPSCKTYWTSPPVFFSFFFPGGGEVVFRPMILGVDSLDSPDPREEAESNVELRILGVDSLSILFNQRSFQKPEQFLFSLFFLLRFRRLSRKKDPWKEWGSYS